jgi:hypothetical protein
VKTIALTVLAAGVLAATRVAACDLCAIYRAAGARGEYSEGLTLTVSEQYMRFGTEQFNGAEFRRANPDFLDRSMTHLVAGWNFSDRTGVSLNLPVVHQRFRFTELAGGFTPVVRDGTSTDAGDLALIARHRLFHKADEIWGLTVNLLGGVKLPSGDTGPLERQRSNIDAYEAVVGPGHDHDALGTVISGIHLHDVSAGSGSVDGIFGLTATARLSRAQFNFQAQYYLRTEGAGRYRYADDLILSGGPAYFAWLDKKGTLSIGFNTVYQTRGADEFRGRTSVHTGLTAWYVGPQLTFTWKSRFSAQAGADVAVRAAGRGFQNTPDFRLNGTLSVRF